jgi:hypothetical protein
MQYACAVSVVCPAVTYIYFIFNVTEHKICAFFNFQLTHCSLARFIVRTGLDVPTFATRRLHACQHTRAPSGGKWNSGREMSGNFV